ncbi:MAG: hypothetical protein QRY72_02050 [Candidatus Rhabdochlamydia sp.]
MTPLSLLHFTKSISPLLQSHTLQKVDDSLRVIQAVTFRTFSSSSSTSPSTFFSAKDIGRLVNPNPLKGKNLMTKVNRPSIALIGTAEKVVWVALSSLKAHRKDSRDIIIPKDHDNHLDKTSRVVLNQIMTTSQNTPLFRKTGVLKDPYLYQQIAINFLKQIEVKGRKLTSQNKDPVTKDEEASHQGNIVQVATDKGDSFKAIVISHGTQTSPVAIVAKITDQKQANSAFFVKIPFQPSSDEEPQIITVDICDLYTVSQETLTVIGKGSNEEVSNIYDQIKKLIQQQLT